MKKIYSLLSFFFIAGLLAAQPVARQQVVLEIGTGTWCPYCPGAAMGADDLIANGCDVAVIEYHSGDSFETTSSDARCTYYNITGFPTAWFDGTLNYVGGSSTTSMYSNYLPLYNQCIVLPSDFSVDINGENTGLTYNVTISVDNMNANTNPNLVVHVALTESEIAYSWQGQSELNYVERLMAPNHNGTPISFTGGSSQQVTVSFTLDPTWNLNHLELVAFVQDASTKEVQQTEKVELINLQPLQATASFTSSTTQPCVTTSVDYFDNSGGNVISWNWSFPGGDPATSTLQNPTVTYNNTGTFDAQLIVTDGTVTDTLLQEDYITVIDIPVQAPTPTGPEQVCQGETGITYTTASVPSASDYTWQLDPASAGTITGNGITATVDLASSYLGSFQVSVRAENNCGIGAWSPSLQVASNLVPADFTLMGYGGFCENSQGIELTLDGSETGVDYELYMDGDPTGQIVAGTGSPISFGYQTTQGLYTCWGFNDYCDNDMIGNSYIFVQAAPGVAGIPIGPEVVCSNGDSVQYVTSGASDADWYDWVLTPSEAGIINGIGEEAWVHWTEGWTGQATINVTGMNDCGTGQTSEDLTVDTYLPPAPEISGDQLVCNNQPGVIYSTNENTGSFYTWEVTGGEVIDGNGTHEVQVTWGDPGTGTITVLEEDVNGCATVTEEYEVVIDDCTGIRENNQVSVKLYPNPVEDVAKIEIVMDEEAEITVRVMNYLGQVVYAKNHNLGKGIQSISIETNEWTEGYYLVSVVDENGQTGHFGFTKTR